MYPSPAETAQRQTASTAFPQSSGAAPRPFLRTAACVGESSDEARFPRLQAHQRRRDTIPKPLPSSTRPLSALGLHRTAFSVLRYSFGNVSGIRLLAPRKRCRTPSALRLYLSHTDRTPFLRASEQARGGPFSAAGRAPAFALSRLISAKIPGTAYAQNGHAPQGLAPQGVHRNAWHRNAWHRKSTRFPVKSIPAETNPALAAFCEKAAAPQTVSTGTRSLSPPIGSSSELQPRRKNKGRRPPIRRESRMQSLKKRLLGQQSAAVFLQRLICQGFTPASALAGRNSQAKKRRQSVLCAGHPMSRPTGPHGGSARPAALAETPKSDSEPSPKFADAASVF